MAYDGKLKFDTGVDTKGFEKDVAELAKLGASAVAAVGAAMVASVKVGSDFEAAMSQVAAVSGATADELTALTAKAQEMGATTKFTAAQAAEALNYMAMAGWKSEQMISGLPGIMNLAAASGESLAAVSDIVTDAMTAFGMSAEESAHFADVLAKASSNANTNVAMMGATFKYVAPIAGSMGYSIEDTAAAIGLLANAGIKGEMAGTSLRAMLTRLVKPPKEAAEALKTLDVSASNADGTMKPLSETVNDLRKAFSGLSDSQKAEYASAIAGTEAMSGLLSIVNASEADFNKLTMAVNSADGAAKQMADTMQDNLQGQLTILQSGLEATGITVYDKFEEPLKKATGTAITEVEKLNKSLKDGELSDSVDDIAEGFSDLTESVVSFTANEVLPAAIDGLEWIVDNGTTVKTVLTAVAGGFIAYKSATIAATVAQAGFNAAAALNPITATIGIATVVGTAASAAMSYASSTMKAKNALSEQALAVQNQTSALREQKQAYQDTVAAAEEKRNAELGEINNVQSLWNELQNYIDKNGKVISNKERVLEITAQINDIMPGTINWLNGEMQAYQDTSAAIDTYITKKRAQAILDSKEPAYNEALSNLPELEKSLAETEGSFKEAQERNLNAANEYLAAKNAYEAYTTNDQESVKKKTEELKKQKEDAWKELQDSSDLLGQLGSLRQEQLSALETYYSGISDYENVFSKVMSGNAEDLKDVYNGIAGIIKASGAKTRDELVNQVSGAKALLDMTKEHLQQGMKGVTETAVAEKQYAYDAAQQQLEEFDLNISKGRVQGSKDWEFLGIKPIVAAELTDINTEIAKAGSVFTETSEEIGTDAGTTLKTEYLGQLSDLVAGSENAFAQLQNKIDGFASHMADVDLFRIEDDEMYVTDLGDKIEQLNEYRQTLQKLTEAGASKDFMANFAQLDIENALNFSDVLFSGDISAYFADWEETQRLSAEISQSFYEDEVNSLKENFTDKLAEQLGGMPDIASQLGADTAKEFVDGFNEQMAQAQLLFAQMQAAVSAEQGSMRSTVGAGVPMTAVSSVPSVVEADEKINVNVTLEMDGEAIAEKTIEVINDKNYTTGRSVIK